ncbi:MAG: PCP reductase family protein [Nitrospiraceae bacterium]
MLVCGCGRWMHTQGVEERTVGTAETTWFVRSECLGCRWRVGVDVTPTQAAASSLVDRMMWTDEAAHKLSRLLPYVQPLVKDEVEQYVRRKQARVITFDVMAEARQGGAIVWDEDAQQRLARVPAAVRAMARVELERTAAERGLSSVTVALMEETKAKYFGMAASKPS